MKLHGSSLLQEETIKRLLGKRLNFVWFPAKLEQDYRFQYQNEIAHALRYRGVIIFLLYSFLCYGIYQLLPQHQVLQWLNLYSWVGIIITAAWIFSWFSKLNQWFDWYAGIGSTIAVALSFTIVNVIQDGAGSILLHAAVMYVVIIIYGFVGLRFYVAMAAGWIGGLLGLVISMHLSSEIAWTLLNRTYTFSSFLGMALAYVTDRQHRENYLQSCLLELHRIDMIDHTQQLEVLSRQDALTGLANRRYLDEMLQEEWFRAMRHQQPMSVLMIDVDHFKAYNDSLGHQAGDECLIKIAQVLSGLVNRSGEIVARYGGEEFLIVLPMTPQSHAIRQANRLMKMIRQLAIMHPDNSASSHVTLSVGVASHIPQLDEEVTDFVNYADQALYQAKSNGRNRYICANIPKNMQKIIKVC